MGDDNHVYNPQERKSFLGAAGRDFVPFKKTKSFNLVTKIFA